MPHRHALEVVDRLLRDITGKRSTPFGGKVVVLGGDFRQCLPVVARGSPSQQVAASIKMSPLWCHFKIINLTRNMRSEDPAFADWVLNIGNGIDGLKVIYNPLEEDLVYNEKDLISHTFGSVINEHTLPNLRKRVILSPTNDNCAQINQIILDSIPGESIIHSSIDEAILDASDTTIIPEEFLNTLTPPGMPPHSLTFKKQAVYILLRNLNISRGLCNGTRFFVKEWRQHIVICERILNHQPPPGTDLTFVLPRIDTSPSKSYPFAMKRRQFPCRPAFAMTINKSQGGTFEKIGVDLTKDVFSHGQLYVALSRVRKKSNITIFLQHGQTETSNIVWQEVLDKDYLDQQIRMRNPRPPVSGRHVSSSDNHYMSAPQEISSSHNIDLDDDQSQPFHSLFQFVPVHSEIPIEPAWYYTGDEPEPVLDTDLP